MAAERLRFSVRDDLIMLHEIIAINPYEDPKLWKEIQQKIIAASGKNFSLRTVKEHVFHLLKLWHRKDKTNLKKSGTEEQYMEKQRLLQEISAMAREAKKRASDSNAKKRGIEARNETICNPFTLKVEPSLNQPISSDMANNTFEETVEECISFTPSNSTLPILDTVNHQERKRCRKNFLKNASLQFLQEKHKSDQAIKMKELELQQRKLELEEKKLEMEKKKLELEEQRLEIERTERQTRLEMEIKERQQRLLQAEKQQNLMECMLQLLSKK